MGVKKVDFDIIPYSIEHKEAWEGLIKQSASGTFLHSRDFLAYHGNRFVDRSVLVSTVNGEFVACMASAVEPLDSDIIISHPGISYGGLLASFSLAGEEICVILQNILTFYAKQGFRALRYKCVPFFYHQRVFQDDLYALFRVGANLYRRDITSVIDLNQQFQFSRRRTRSLQRAKKNNLKLQSGTDYLADFWCLLNDTLRKHHNVSSVHSKSEIGILHSRFPDNISFMYVLKGTELVAGAVLFESATTCHIQYISASEHGREISATDFLVEQCINRAKCRGLRYFDLGISTEESGKVLNESLYNYKNSFGAGSVTHDFYEISLTDTGACAWA